MAMIRCPECLAEVSDKADSCPKCGYSFAAKRKKKEQSLRSCGCLVVFAVLFCIALATCSKMGGSSEATVQQTKTAEDIAWEQYQERVGRCVIGKHLATYPTNVLKENLVSPRSYEADSTKCDFPKKGEVLKDTLSCIHYFTSKNKLGVDLPGYALVTLVLPTYDESKRMERCKIQINNIESR